MLNRLLFLLLLSVLMLPNAFAEEIKRLAVLEFRGVGIQPEYLLKLSDQSRRAALDSLPSDQYLIMTRENMLQILGDMGLDPSCLEGTCEVDVGRNIQADAIIAGDIMLIQSTYVLTLKLYDTHSGRLLSTLDVENTDLLRLKNETYQSSKELLQQGLGLESSDMVSSRRTSVTQKPRQTQTFEGDGYQAQLIPAGTFTMGCTGSGDCGHDEFPTHQVTLTNDFYMMRSEVTQKLYQEVMGNNPSEFTWFGSKKPVEEVSWLNAAQFANRLSQMEGLEPCYQIDREQVTWSDMDCKGWRLPTEAEWEYAAKAGQLFIFAGSNRVGQVAWYDGYLGTHRVCRKKTNDYGLCDMSGNVLEWVWDWYGDYSSQSGTDLAGPSSGQIRVYRGGGWGYDAGSPRVSYRNFNDPGREDYYLGFRPGRTP